MYMNISWGRIQQRTEELALLEITPTMDREIILVSRRKKAEFKKKLKEEKFIIL